MKLSVVKLCVLLNFTISSININMLLIEVQASVYSRLLTIRVIMVNLNEYQDISTNCRKGPQYDLPFIHTYLGLTFYM
jgi:hypothetical protein